MINFRPWLVGSRDALLTSLFSEFSKGIDQYRLEQGDQRGVNATKAKEVAETMRAFGAGIAKLGGLVEVIGDVSAIAPIKLLGKLLSRAREPLKEGKQLPSLVELKDKLSSSLNSLNHRFVVTIDDVDRLEPGDIVEVMRLVRSVADFPNVIYVLCYDSGILKHSIEQIARVKDGAAFLEKIVQLTVMVPDPEPFRLRQWFADDLSRIAKAAEPDQADRLRAVIDMEGGRQLKTPRSVVRALDAIRFFWPPLERERADLADLVWLLLIKVAIRASTGGLRITARAWP